MTTITTIAPDTDLAAVHAALVTERKTDGLTAGVAASLSRKIGALELEMELSGIEYVPYAPESRSVYSLTDKSVDELKSMLAATITERENATTSGVKARLTRQVRFIEATLTDRGVKVTPWTSTTQPRLSADDLLVRIAALQRLLARGDQVRPKIAKMATDQLTALTNMAEDRGVDVPAAPETAPAPSPADALAQTDADAIAAMDSATRPQKRSRKVTA